MIKFLFSNLFKHTNSKKISKRMIIKLRGRFENAQEKISEGTWKSKI